MTVQTLLDAEPRTRGPNRSLLVAEYHARVFRQLWQTGAVSMVVTPVLYLLAMGVGVGQLVDAQPSPALGDSSYLQFVAPGLMAAAAMQTAMGAALFPVLASVKWMKTAYALSATPVRPFDLMLGHQLWLAVQMTVGGIVFLGVAAVAGVVRSPMAVLAPLAAALGGLAYSSIGAAWAIGREHEWSFMPILRLGILPSFLLSGTFFPISQLPELLQPLAAVMPLWHSVSLSRGVMDGSLDGLQAVGHTGVLLAYVALGLAWGARSYRARLYR